MNDNSTEIKYKIYYHKKYAFLATAIIILLYFLGGIITSVFLMNIDDENLKHSIKVYSQGFLQISFILLPTIYFAKKALLPFNLLMRRKTKINIYQIIFAIIGILAFQIFASGFMILQEKVLPESLLTFYKNIEEMIEGMYLNLLGGSGYLDLFRALLIGALIPALSEETLFRGFLQTSLEQDYKPVKAIIITSLIFSLLHMNPVALIPLIGIGIYLGFLAYVTNNLVVPMIAHFINNSLAILIIYNSEFSEFEAEISNISPISALLLTISGLLIVIFCSYSIFQNRQKQQ